MSFVRSWIKWFLKRRGYVIVHSKNALTKAETLDRWKAAPVATVLDIGASDGRWSKSAMRFFSRSFLFPHGSAKRSTRKRLARM